MQHTTFVYVMAPDGRYVTLLSPTGGQTPEAMAGRLRELVNPVTAGQISSPTSAGPAPSAARER